MTIFYKTDSRGKVLSIMVTNVHTDTIESLPPCHEIRRAKWIVSYDDCGSYWILLIPFDGEFYDVSDKNIYEEHLRKFHYHRCYNVKDRKVILC